MTSVVLQIVSKPVPGADVGVVMGNLKAAAEVWRSGGAEVKVWTVSAGEIGNMVFTAAWPSFEAYGKSMDKLLGDQAIQQLVARITASGVTEWVRSNLVRELPI